ncbi:MAG: hypothetical protein MJA83_10610, partial [Gammaproteobacteria bacterium]|nr:hypothetical protein [Gammaproteobacteria bacterium]
MKALKFLLSVVILFAVSSLSAQINVDSVRDTTFDYACMDENFEILSRHQRQDKADAACLTRQLNDPDGTYYVQGGRWRLAVTGALAQLRAAGQDPIGITGVSGGELGSLVPGHAYADVILDENGIDVSAQYALANIHAKYLGVQMLRTNWADRSSTSTNIAGVTLDTTSQVTIWIDDRIDPIAAWVDTAGYQDYGFDLTINGQTASGFSANKTGALQFDGITTTGSSAFENYVVSFSPMSREQQPITVPPPDNNGFYRFADPAA